VRRTLPAVLILAGVVFVWAQQPSEDAELRAMRDEVARSKAMSLPNLDPPYFVQYLLDESSNFNVSASLGGILSRRTETVRSPETRVRVGDYKFDNSNYTGSGFNFGARYDLGGFPLEGRYDIMRRHLWLQTDSAYKSAVEALSRKRAAVRNLNQTEQLADFAKAPPLKQIRPLSKLTIDENLWTGRVREISSFFARYPEVKNSTVELESSAGGFTLVNSEGTEVREPESVSVLRLRATTQAEDGMTLRDWATFHALDPAGLPDLKTAEAAVKALAENVTALAKAPKGEDYSGPVLFEGAAGAQILGEVLGKNLSLTRRPVSEGGRGGGFQPGELEGRIGARVLPDSFDVVDDPSRAEWRGRKLFGHYEADREGVAPKPLKLVEKGVLKGYLLTRQPVRGFEGSNGRARMPGSYGASTAGFSNLFVESSQTVPVAELKKKLIELCQARSKPYGIIIRKMDFPSAASLDEARRLLQGGQGRPISMPLLVYKVFPDGREELVRALRFRGLNAKSLRDILAAGDDPTVFELMDNAAPFALVGASGFSTEAAVIAPSILIDDLELHPLEDEQPKLPVVPAPTLSIK
jgi:TldD protein